MTTTIRIYPKSRACVVPGSRGLRSQQALVSHAPRSLSSRAEARRDVLVRSPVDMLLVLMSMTVACTKTLWTSLMTSRQVARLVVTCHAYSMGGSAMHRTRCDCNGGARNTTYNQREPSAFVRDPLRAHKTAHRLGKTSETACSRSVAMARGSVVRDGATCVVRAIDGDRGGARDSSQLITVCCAPPPLRSAFLQLMTLRSTSSNP